MEKKLFAKLKKVCKNCTEASMKVYMRNIKRLYKLNNESEIPPISKEWLFKPALMKKFKELPLKAKRPLSLAAVKFAKLVDTDPKEWYKQMMKANGEYMEKRGKNLKSENEKEKWPKDGYKAIRKAANELWKRIKHKIKNDKPSLRNLYNYQAYIVLRLFSEVPFRNDFATFSLKDVDNNNFIQVPKKGSIIFFTRNYKNSKQLGEKKITLSRGATTQLRKFLKYREQVVDNEFFLNTLKGTKMSKSTMGKMLTRTTEKLLHKKIGSRIIRVLAATASKRDIEKVAELSNKLLHSTKQTQQYVRKD